jgi:hypothetical protein
MRADLPVDVGSFIPQTTQLDIDARQGSSGLMDLDEFLAYLEGCHGNIVAQSPAAEDVMNTFEGIKQELELLV